MTGVSLDSAGVGLSVGKSPLIAAVADKTVWRALGAVGMEQRGKAWWYGRAGAGGGGPVDGEGEVPRTGGVLQRDSGWTLQRMLSGLKQQVGAVFGLVCFDSTVVLSCAGIASVESSVIASTACSCTCHVRLEAKCMQRVARWGLRHANCSANGNARLQPSHTALKSTVAGPASGGADGHSIVARTSQSSDQRRDADGKGKRRGDGNVGEGKRLVPRRFRLRPGSSVSAWIRLVIRIVLERLKTITAARPPLYTAAYRKEAARSRIAAGPHLLQRFWGYLVLGGKAANAQGKLSRESLLPASPGASWGVRMGGIDFRMGGLDAREWKWDWGEGSEEAARVSESSIAGEERDPELAAAWKQGMKMPSSATCMLDSMLPYTAWRTGEMLCCLAFLALDTNEATPRPIPPLQHETFSVACQIAVLRACIPRTCKSRVDRRAAASGWARTQRWGCCSSG